MARNDGIDRTSARNVNLTAAKIGNAQRHNEREKESYTNPDVIPERTPQNIHFKKPTAGYAEMFAQMEKDGVISTRGLKSDANLYGELIFDVNSAYFYNHGGYEFAKRFYEDAYKAAIEIVGGEQYILSAVMHADERNRAMSEALGQDVSHYHLHVVYVPVVEKQILWSKRCKDKSLVGTVKETIMQVSSSKKWLSKPALDEQGTPILQKNGKPVLRKSYSVLQDDFFQAMRNAGYTDVERGERGSSEEHLTVTQFKVEREQERLEQLTVQTQQKEQQAASLEKKIEKIQKQQIAVQEVEQIEPHAVPFSSKVMLDRSEYENLAAAAKKFYVQERKESKLQKALDAAMKMISELKAKVTALTAELAEYKSVRGQLRTADLEKENSELRSKIRKYEDVISRNNLWSYFLRHKEKVSTKINIYPLFGMAIGNLGRVYQDYGVMDYDDGHQDYFHYFAYSLLKKAVECKDPNTHKAAKDCFLRAMAVYTPQYVEGFLQKDLEIPQFSYENCEEKMYREWAVENNLFLNTLNDLPVVELCFATDVLQLPDMIVSIDAKPIFHGMFNQIKQEYVYARYQYYLSFVCSCRRTEKQRPTSK